MDYTVHGNLQARILEWIAFPSSRGSFPPRAEPRPPALQAASLPSEPPGSPAGGEAPGVSLSCVSDLRAECMKWEHLHGESPPLGDLCWAPLHPGPAPRLPLPRLDCRSTSSSLWHLSDALFTPAQPPEGWQACSSHDLDVLCVPGGISDSDLPPPPLFAPTKFAAAEARPIWAAGAVVCSDVL